MTEMTKNQKTVLEALSTEVGTKMADLVKKAGLSPHQTRAALISLEKQGAVFVAGPVNKTLWYRDVKPPVWEFAPEYIKVSSVFRVGQRYAAQEAR